MDNFIYFFELNLIRDLGYDTNLSKFRNDKSELADINKIKIDNFIYEVPNYLILGKIPKKINNYLIKKSLYFTRNIIQNKFFLPNKIHFPQSRIILENYFN